MGLGTCGNRDMWGRDMCPHPNSIGTNGIGTYGVGTYGVGTCGIGTYVLEPSKGLPWFVMVPQDSLMVSKWFQDYF